MSDDDRMMREGQGRVWLVLVTLLSLLMQLLKLGSRYLVLQQLPAPSQWGQFGFVIVLIICFWVGGHWARILGSVFYGLSTISGIILLILFGRIFDTTTLIVSGINILIACKIALILQFSPSVKSYFDRHGPRR